MNNAGFSQEKIIAILKAADAGQSVASLCREHGISPTVFNRWRSRFDDLGVAGARRVRQLEAENERLRRLVAEQVLDIDMLMEVVTQRGMIKPCRHTTTQREVGTHGSTQLLRFHKGTVRAL